MSYDLEIATPQDAGSVAAWAEGRGLRFDEGAVVRAGAHGERVLFTVDGPLVVEADDLDEELAAACLAPRWLWQISVPAGAPTAALREAKALARHLAESGKGAAFDPQEDRVFWPRGARRAPSAPPGQVDVVRIRWFLAPDRWPGALAILLEELRRRLPEGLPRRYGTYEPPPYRFEPDDPGALLRYALEHPEGESGYWLARRPVFGGDWRRPQPPGRLPGVGTLDLDVDGRVVAADPRWRETVAALIIAVADRAEALFAAAQVDPDWLVSSSYRLSTMMEPSPYEHILQGMMWQGLPPVPMWIAWFGQPYDTLVDPAAFSHAEVTQGRTGWGVRMAESPKVADELGAWPVPAELTYRGRGGEHAEPGDEARTIPPF